MAVWNYCDTCEWYGDIVQMFAGLWNCSLAAAIAELKRSRLLSSDVSDQTIKDYLTRCEQRNRMRLLWTSIRKHFSTLSRDQWWPMAAWWNYEDPETARFRQKFSTEFAVCSRHMIEAVFGRTLKTKGWLPHWIVFPGYSAPGRIDSLTCFGTPVPASASPVSVTFGHNSKRRPIVGRWWKFDTSPLWVADTSTACRILAEHGSDAAIAGPATLKRQTIPQLWYSQFSCTAVWSPERNEPLASQCDRRAIALTHQPRYSAGRSLRTWINNAVAKASLVTKNQGSRGCAFTQTFVGTKRVSSKAGETRIDDEIVANFRVMLTSRFLHRGVLYFQVLLEFKDNLKYRFAVPVKSFKKLRHFRGVYERQLGFHAQMSALKISSRRWEIVARSAINASRPPHVGIVHETGWVSSANGYAFSGLEVRPSGVIVPRPAVTHKTNMAPGGVLSETTLQSRLVAMPQEDRKALWGAAVVYLSCVMQPAYGRPEFKWLSRRPFTRTWRSLGGRAVTLDRYKKVATSRLTWVKWAKADYKLAEMDGVPVISPELPWTIRTLIPKEQPSAEFGLIDTRETMFRPSPLPIAPMFLQWLQMYRKGQLCGRGSFEAQIAAALGEWLESRFRIKDPMDDVMTQLTPPAVTLPRP